MRGFGAEVDRAICPSTVTGHSYAVGCVRIGAFHKRNSRSTWGSSSSCTTSASEAKRCFLRSLSCWSRKTLESNKSVHEIWPRANLRAEYAGSWDHGPLLDNAGTAVVSGTTAPLGTPEAARASFAGISTPQ